MFKETIPNCLGSRTSLAAELRRSQCRPPSFLKPFYDAVKAVSQDWILPGVDKAEANTASRS